MQHSKNKDRSAMNISKEEKEWANNLVFDSFTEEWVKNNSTNYYTSYYPPGEKKLGEKVAFINFLKLRNAEPKEILDIGTGAGHFIVLTNSLGHKSEGTDLENSVKDCTDLHQHYGVNVFPLYVEKQTKIKLPKKYDIITSLRINFDYNLSPDRYWTKDDWLFFKDNMFEYLNPNGCLFLKSNIKCIPGRAQREIEAAYGDTLPGWNSLTFQLFKS